MNGQTIAETALKYVGQREILSNKGFIDPDFQSKIKATGWQKGEAWCAYFGEMVLREAYANDPVLLSEVVKLFSASAVKTWYNFDASDWKTVDANGKNNRIPVVGAVAIWRTYRNGRAQSSGHLGIVTAIDDLKRPQTTEGNTNAVGGREGEIVANKTRLVDFSVNNGLRLIGFIYPKTSLLLEAKKEL